MEAHRRVCRRQRLPVAQSHLGQVDRIADDGMSQIPEMHPNLIRASCSRHSLHKRFAVLISRQHAKLCFGRIAAVSVNDPKAVVRWSPGDRLARRRVVPGRVAGHAAQIGLPGHAAFELRLDGLGCVAAAGKHHEPSGVCVEPMSGGEVLPGKRTGQDLRHAVAVKPTAWMHRQRRRLVEHDVVVFPCNDSDRRVHIRLDRVGLEPREAMPASDDEVGRQRAFAIAKVPPADDREPFLAGDVGMAIAQKINQRPAVVPRRHVEGPLVGGGSRPGQGIARSGERRFALREGDDRLLSRRLRAERARHRRNIVLRLLVFHGEWLLAGVALGCRRLLEPRIQRHAVVEDEAVAGIMVAAAFLEILQDASLQLIDLLKAFLLHERARLLAPDAAGAKHHDRLLLQLWGELPHRRRKLAKVVHADWQGVFEGAEPHLVVVAGVEEREGAALVEPLLEFHRRELRRRVIAGPHAFDTESDDLAFDFDEKSAERLVVAHALLGIEVGQQRVAAEMADELLDTFARPGQNEVDALGTQQNRSLQVPRRTYRPQFRTPLRQPVERREPVGGDVHDGHGHSISTGAGWMDDERATPNRSE